MIFLLAYISAQASPKHYNRQQRDAKIYKSGKCFPEVNQVLKDNNLKKKDVKQLVEELSDETGIRIYAKDKKTVQLMITWICEHCSELNEDWEEAFGSPIESCGHMHHSNHHSKKHKSRDSSPEANQFSPDDFPEFQTFDINGDNDNL